MDAKKLIFVDECAAKSNMSRLYGTVQEANRLFARAAQLGILKL
jgi:hypothetical protein